MRGNGSTQKGGRGDLRIRARGLCVDAEPVACCPGPCVQGSRADRVMRITVMAVVKVVSAVTSRS